MRWNLYRYLNGKLYNVCKLYCTYEQALIIAAEDRQQFRNAFSKDCTTYVRLIEGIDPWKKYGF